MNTLPPAALFCLCLSALCHLSKGAVYVGSAYEPFDYGTAVDAANPTTDGNLPANAGGFGFNATGDSSLPNTTAWGGTGVPASAGSTTVISGSLSGVSPIGNRAAIAGVAATAAAAGRGLGQTVDAGTFYFSYLTDRNNTSLRTVNMAFFQGTTEKLAIGQFGGATGTVTSGDFALLALNSNPANLITSATPINYGNNVTHLVIGRIDFNANGANERIRIYIDPSNLSDVGQLTPYLDNSAFDLASITAFRPFAGGTATGFTEAASGDFDEVRFGGTFASVIAVPEPGTAVLVSLGGLALAASRRRRVSSPLNA